MSRYPTFALWLFLSFALQSSMFVPLLQGQAFCALRDPLASIQTLYPEATTYRSIVSTIDSNIRQQVAERLPPETLHFGELGRHTLYVAMKKTKPLGYVHVRSEESDWGLIEIAWALDFELRIRNFLFQRCRDRTKHALEAEAFLSRLRGKDFESLKEEWLKGQGNLDHVQWGIPEKAKALAHSVIICGLKTMLVTRLAWPDDIESVQKHIWVLPDFPRATELQPFPFSLENPAALREQGFTIHAVESIMDADGQRLGFLLLGDVELMNRSVSTYWVIDAALTIRKVQAVGGWNDPHAEVAFALLSYQQTGEPSEKDCSDQAQLIAQQTLSQLKHWLAHHSTDR